MSGETEDLREAIAREVDPRVFDRSRWYHEHEMMISRCQLLARIDITLQSQAFADWLARHDAAARADERDGISEWVRASRERDNTPCSVCGGDRLRTDFTTAYRCHAPYPQSPDLPTTEGVTHD